MTDIIINLIQNFGLPVGLMIWMMTIGQKTLNDICCNMKSIIGQKTLNDICCNMKSMVESNQKLREDIRYMVDEIRKASDKETRTILEWMLEQTKKK